jgi:hypothetical protein
MQAWWYKKTGFLLLNYYCKFTDTFSLYTFFYFSSFFSFCVWLCGWSCKCFYLFGNLWENYCLSNWFFPFKEPLYSTHDITNLPRFLPIFLWFSCLLEFVDNVSQFLVLYFCFQFLHFFSYFSFWFCVSFSSFWMFCFLFCVSLSVFLFPVSVFLFSFLLSFWVVFLFLVAGIYFSNFWFCFF